jgi:hypothetical protein
VNFHNCLDWISVNISGEQILLHVFVSPVSVRNFGDRSSFQPRQVGERHVERVNSFANLKKIFILFLLDTSWATLLCLGFLLSALSLCFSPLSLCLSPLSLCLSPLSLYLCISPIYLSISPIFLFLPSISILYLSLSLSPPLPLSLSR